MTKRWSSTKSDLTQTKKLAAKRRRAKTKKLTKQQIADRAVLAWAGERD